MIANAAALDLMRPRHLREALAFLAEAADAGQPLTPIAGGTDLFVVLNAGGAAPKHYLDLWGLDELRGIHRDGRALTLGALTTWTDCIESKAVHKLLPILADAAREIGGVQIQNRGTVAGNVGNASPAADGVPVLAAADAFVILASLKAGERAVSLANYYTGYRQTVRRPDELIVRLEMKPPKGRQLFRKVGPRAAQAISKIALAAVGHNLALGSVAPTVVRARHVEAYVQSGGRDPEEARRRVQEDITPIDDVRSTAEYRRRVAGNLVAEWMRSEKKR